MRRYRLLALAALALSIAAVAAGCGGGGSTTTTEAAGVTVAPTPGQTPASIFNDPARFVLTEDDVPTGYVVDAENTRAVTNADAARGRDNAYLRNLESMGRISGYASGWRPGSADVQGPLQVESSASTFETVGGASDAFALGVKEVGNKFTKVEMKESIGDEARMYSTVIKGADGDYTLYTAAWRYDRVLATLSVASLKDTVTPGDAMVFAQKQQERIKAAAREKIGK